jgi:segregation and condensation protein B
MDETQKKRIVEALIVAAPEPVPLARVAEIVPRATTKSVREWIGQLNEEYQNQGRGFEIWEVAGGFQVRTLPDLAPWVQQLHKLRPARLSTPALETLSVVAYRQPITRSEIEDVRGVDVGATLRSLVERKLVRIAGHREAPGRPMVYATTRRFLEVFGLKKLDDLPTLRDLEELASDEMLAEVADGDAPAADVEAAAAVPADAGGEREDSKPTAAAQSTPSRARTGSSGSDGLSSADAATPGMAPAPRSL